MKVIKPHYSILSPVSGLMRELMCPLLDELKRLLPVVFDDIEVNHA